MGDGIVTIQKTTKQWKRWQASSMIVLIIGFILFLKGMFGGGGGGLAGFGFLFILVAFALALYARIGAWWTTG
jgi:hypothetical protein